MKKLLTALLALALLGNGSMAMAVEEPSYELMEKSGEFEIREYRPMIIADTVVEGDLDTASNRGFRLIAAYIFGDNTGQGADGRKEKIAMTAPVIVEPGTRLAMTAPVSAEPQGSAGLQANQWRVEFVMPSQYTMAALPRPRNPLVTLREVPATRYAVIRFSGFAGQEKVQQKTAQLMDWLHQRGLEPAGAPRLARYNPPWTLPFLRRNEVMLKLMPITTGD